MNEYNYIHIKLKIVFLLMIQIIILFTLQPHNDLLINVIYNNNIINILLLLFKLK